MRATFLAALTLAATVSMAMPTFSQSIPLPAKVSAPSGRYELDPAHTSVLWRIQHLGLEQYTAKFTKIAGTVDYDAGDPILSKLDVTIDANSVHTDFPLPTRRTSTPKSVASWVRQRTRRSTSSRARFTRQGRTGARLPAI